MFSRNRKCNILFTLEAPVYTQKFRNLNMYLTNIPEK